MAQNIIKLGRCGVCGGEAIITAQDPPTGIQVGRCCESDLLYAHRQINLILATVPDHGLRHPVRGEFTHNENH